MKNKKFLLLLPALLILTGQGCLPRQPQPMTPPVNTPADEVPANTPAQPNAPASPNVPPTNDSVINPPTIENVTFNLSATEYKFSQSSLTVTTDDQVRVTLKNEGTMPHDFVISSGGVQVRTRVLQPGEEDAVAFRAPDEPTILTYYCSVNSHQALGMQGTINVVTSPTE